MTLASNISYGGRAISYDRIYRAGPLSDVESRWIGRCKKCRATHKLDGHLMIGARSAGQGYGSTDDVIQTSDGRIYTCGGQGTSPSTVWAPCGDHYALLKRVHEGTKKSKHECGARCMSATGPNCDCRCRGAMHGSNC